MNNKWNDKAVLQAVNKRIIQRLQLVGEFVQGMAVYNISGHAGKHLQAVDTGRLMDSIIYKVDKPDLSVRIGTNVEYAPYIEFGTSKIAPRPFLRTAFNENQDNIKKILGGK